MGWVVNLLLLRVRIVGILGLGFLAAACGVQADKVIDASSPPHHTANGFRNLHIEHSNKSFFDFIALRYFSNTVWADHEARADEVPIQRIELSMVQNPPKNVQISWLGHSTFLIQKDGLNILTDPIFGDRASPVSFAGPKRYVPHVMDYKDLPKIDYVIISHNHYDHLDNVAVRHLGDQPVYLVPLGLKPWFIYQGVSPGRIVERDWWDRSQFEDVTIQAMPSQHWSARGLFDRHETLWASWLIDYGDYSIWFAGDTGYNEIQFKEIGAATGGVDLGLIPIGGYAPRSFMKTYHVNPEEAILLHQDIKARKSIGMHWGTFPLTAEGPIDPYVELLKQRELYQLNEEEFITMRVGETLTTGSVMVSEK
jgi:N-acyl-phosphatidylethanolamine-hydrolysing phospholipase D